MLLSVLAVATVVATGSARAQAMDTKAITLAGAKQMVQAAEAEAERNNWNVAIAIVDANGELILLHRRDGTQLASINIAIGKASTAARFKRPSKALEDAVAAGRTSLVAVDGIYPMEGGIPVTVDGQVIGAIGVSGVMSNQDAQVAQTGLDAFRP